MLRRNGIENPFFTLFYSVLIAMQIAGGWGGLFASRLGVRILYNKGSEVISSNKGGFP